MQANETDITDTGDLNSPETISNLPDYFDLWLLHSRRRAFRGIVGALKFGIILNLHIFIPYPLWISNSTDSWH